jgi:hypothetical protein
MRVTSSISRCDPTKTGYLAGMSVFLQQFWSLTLKGEPLPTFFCRRGLQWRRLHLLIFFSKVIKFYWLMLLLYPGEVNRLLGASSSYFNLLLWNNYWLGQMEPNLAESIYIRSSIKFLHFVPFHQQIWLPRAILVSDWLMFKKSSPLKLLDQMEPNLTGSIYVRSSIKLLHLVPFGPQTWPLLLKIEHMVKLHVFGNNSKNFNNIRNLTG